MRAFWILIVIVSATVGWFSTTASNVPPQQFLLDVSWPNCGVTLGRAEHGIVGINGGLAFRANPCLAHEASRFDRLDVYVNTGYPGAKIASRFSVPKACKKNDDNCLAYNYGYNSGVYDLKLAFSSGVIAKRWWLDVETENSWSEKTEVNRASLQGTLDALDPIVGKANLGFYSYPGQWDKLTGKWHNNYPAWVATGSKKLRSAEEACASPSFSGGPVRLAQYTPELDQNLVCAISR